MDHISPVPQQLHWLPVTQRIALNILVLVYKALHSLAPSYLPDQLLTSTPSRTVRSSFKFCLVLPRMNLASMGSQAYSYAAPYLWNMLSQDIRNSDSLSAFKSRLKTPKEFGSKMR